MTKKADSIDLRESVRSWTSSQLRAVVDQLAKVDGVLATLGPLQQLQVSLAAEMAMAELRGVVAGIQALRDPLPPIQGGGPQP